MIKLLLGHVQLPTKSSYNGKAKIEKLEHQSLLNAFFLLFLFIAFVCWLVVRCLLRCVVLDLRRNLQTLFCTYKEKVFLNNLILQSRCIKKFNTYFPNVSCSIFKKLPLQRMEIMDKYHKFFDADCNLRFYFTKIISGECCNYKEVKS